MNIPTIAWATPLLLLAGAFLNRHRGGWIGTEHTQWARANFAIGMAGLLALVLLDWHAFAAAPMMFAGCLPGQGDDGHDDTPQRGFDLFLSGTLNHAGIPVTAAILTHHWALLAIAPIVGALKPLAYFPPLVTRLPKIRRLWPGKQFAVDSEWGEVLFGVAHGAGLAAIAALR